MGRIREKLSVSQWLPSGEAILFLAARGTDEDKKKGTQLWRLPRTGGEAERLTDVDGGVADFAVAPVGQRVALVRADPKAEPEKLEGWKRKTAPPLVIDRFDFKRDKEGYLDREAARPRHLHLFDLISRKTTQLTTGEFSERSPAWSPDGKQLAFLSNRQPDRDRTQAVGLYLMAAEANAPARQLAVVTTDDDARPAWRPNGEQIALPTGDDVKWTAYQAWKVQVFDLVGGAQQVLSGALDRGFQADLNWLADGSALVGVVSDDRSTWLARVSVTGAVERLTTGQSTIQAFSVARDGSIVVVRGDAKHPPELAVVEPSGSRTITRHHEEWVDGLQLSRTQEFSSISADGTEVHGLLSLPATAPAGQRLPTVLLVHGGPNSQDAHELRGRQPILRERLSASGYAVLQVNYRGSRGRGQAFQRAIFADWCNKEVQDLHGAVDWAVKQGIADPARLGIGGWSYGGILTDCVIATDKRFKAAVSGAGSGNQISMLGTDQYAVQYERELGMPWVKPEVWQKVSYAFFRADRITTPTLFLGGEKDFNVPIAGGEQMYLALKALGVPTQLVIYPGQFHTLELPYVRDWEDRFIAWMNRYLSPER